MANITPNQIVDFKKKLISFQKRTFSSNYLFLFIFLLISSITTAQTIFTETYIANLKAKSETDATAFDHLLKDLQPAIYFSKGVAKTYGDNPISLYIGLNEITNINDTSISKDNIEIIYLEINSDSDLNNKIDLDTFSKYPKLKYISILSNIYLTENTVNKLIKNYNSQFVILLRVTTGG